MFGCGACVGFCDDRRLMLLADNFLPLFQRECSSFGPFRHNCGDLKTGSCEDLSQDNRNVSNDMTERETSSDCRNSPSSVELAAMFAVPTKR